MNLHIITLITSSIIIRVNVLCIGLEFPPLIGGGGTYNKNLVLGLATEGIKVTVITAGEEDKTEAINENLVIKRYKALFNLYRGKSDILPGVEILISQIQELKPDIIHTFHSTETLIGLIANKNYYIPHVVTNNRTPHYKQGLTTKDDKSTFYDYVNNNEVQHHIVISKIFQKALLQNTHGIDINRVSLIYPGIDRKRFAPMHAREQQKLKEKLNIKEQDLVVLIPAKIRTRKGLLFLAQALSDLRINNQYPRIILTGNPKEEKDLILYNKIQQVLAPTNKLIVHEDFSDEEMSILYSMADLTILPSEAEGLGLVLLEAMSCCSPVIGTNVNGIREVIQDGENGILVEYGDIKGMQNAIRKTLTDMNYRESLIRGGLGCLETKFNLEKQAKEHIKVYQQLNSDSNNEIGCILYRVSMSGEIEVMINNQNTPLLKTTIQPGFTQIESMVSYLKRFFHNKNIQNPDYTLPLKEEYNTTLRCVMAFEVKEDNRLDNTGIRTTEILRDMTWVNAGILQSDFPMIKELEKRVFSEF